MLVPLRPSSEHILIVRAPGARDQHGCHSTPFIVGVPWAQETNGLPPRLPLDAAADTRLLIAVDRLSGERSVDRGTQITACDRLVAAGATVVELSAVDEPPIPIEEIEIRGAGCPIGFRHVLAFIKTEGKGEAETLGHFLQPWWRIVRIARWIVAADADDAKPCACIVLSQLRKFLLDVFHIGTVAANEHDQQRSLAGKGVQ
jgi:hypothetical protein